MGTLGNGDAYCMHIHIIHTGGNEYSSYELVVCILCILLRTLLLLYIVVVLYELVVCKLCILRMHTLVVLYQRNFFQGLACILL